jgi:uncharacterized protein YdiU (UPF0061 family)
MDYGPFGFLDHTALDHICNHTDSGGRYAYHRQPKIMHWNMACLANAMVPLVEMESPGEDAADLLRAALSTFPSEYESKWLALFRAKLGLQTDVPEDMDLIEALLQLMHANRADFTNVFRSLSTVQKMDTHSNWHDQFLDRDAADAWLMQYCARLMQESSSDTERAALMNRINPKFILRNHLAQRAIEMAQQDDFSEVNRLQRILSRPFDDQTEHERYASAPLPDEVVSDLSCSS